MGKKKLAISLLVFAGVLSFSETKVEAANQHHLLNQMHYHAINNIYKPAQNCAVLQNRILDQYCKQPTTKVAYQHVQKNTQQATQQQANQQQAAQQQATQQQAVQQQAVQQQAVQQQEAAQQQAAQQQAAQQQAAQQQAAQKQAAQQQAAQQQAAQQQAVQQQQRTHHNYTPQQATGHHNRHH
ncbi:hypothetical protein JZO81_04600 [Enterococcus hulanensis]|uniref:hypothetical protein n=1 Tax=Enterococcus TaxID=1350 RepID=UPI000B747316|nr:MULTISPECIES: hypothetical protein [Enterococcus]MBO0410319.1 hypothetical protein [Enterococcus hulanensis]OTO14509.1 hypothetical protein A5875_003666 [Enterococcus sp. 3H8_DIV0648]